MNDLVKFRPSLTSSQIAYLISILQSSPACSERNDVLGILHKFHLKAIHGIVAPSHVASPKISIEDALGFGSSPSPADSIDTLLEIYKSNPTILSPTQLSKVAHHRYVNDMMSAEEESEYERMAIGQIGK